MANTAFVEKKLFVDPTNIDKATDKIRELIVEFIEEDVVHVLSDVEEDYETMELPQRIQLVIKPGKNKDNPECAKNGCVDCIVAAASLAEYSDSIFTETKEDTITGYARIGSDWERISYYRTTYAEFSVEYDANNGELHIIAECNAQFSVKYDSWDEFCEITREDYSSEIKTMISDEKTVIALDKATFIDDCSEEELKDLDDKDKLTEEEELILFAIGYLGNDDNNDN